MKNTKSKDYDWVVFVLAVILFFSISVYFLYQNKSSEVLPIQPTIESSQPSASIPTLIPIILATSSLAPTQQIAASPTQTPTVSPTVNNSPAFTPAPSPISIQQPTEAQTPTFTPTNTPDFGLTHVIQPGQYLTGISLHYYGTGRRWKDIYELTNARAGEGRYQKIDNPNLIFPDDWLMIPIIE